jgi:cellulose synthase/poly-beta-1,6-N-acetylglucosamine synthase-like glycosyltransferase
MCHLLNLTVKISLNNLLVSIIIPCYNAEKYLAETIRSILDQSYQHLEIILVDDGSSDGSIAIATSFNDHRIIILKQQIVGRAQHVIMVLHLVREILSNTWMQMTY